MEAHGPAFCFQPVRTGCVNVGGQFTAYQINRIYLVLLELGRGRQINGPNMEHAIGRIPYVYSPNGISPVDLVSSAKIRDSDR